MYRELDIDKLLKTATQLQNRIKERFPESGLSQVGAEVCVVVQEARNMGAKLKEPMLGLRVGVGFLIFLIVSLVVMTLANVKWNSDFFEIGQFFEATEAFVSEVVVLGAGIFFLTTVETRLKRRRALSVLNQYRALAHVIDMHQLTKDPVRLKRERRLATSSSPKRVLTNFQLQRYLDYCSEMLSILGKTAIIYAQHLDDPVVIATVNEIEELCNGLSSKIWQKITNARMEGD